MFPRPESPEASSQNFGTVVAAVAAALLVGLAAGFGLRPEQTIKPAEIPQAPIEATADAILRFI